jgi:hypothetical protein
LLGSLSLQSKEPDRGETLDWLQERLVLDNEQLIELAKRFPKVHALSVEERLKPTLDWLQERLEFSDEELVKLVRRQPMILNLASRQTGVGSREPPKGSAASDANGWWLGTIAWVKDGREPRADSCLASREIAS